MKEKFTSINIILDGSGSMSHLTDETIQGVNKFIQEQKLIPGEAVLSLHIFSTFIKTVCDFETLDKVKPLDRSIYYPNNGTALLDAVGSSIDKLGKKLSSMEESERPDKVLFLIITDGQENSSSLVEEDQIIYPYYVASSMPSYSSIIIPKLRYSLSKIKEMIKHQQEKYNWRFMFYGANVDAFAEGASMGIAAQNSIPYISSPEGLNTLYNSISSTTTTFRNS